MSRGDARTQRQSSEKRGTVTDGRSRLLKLISPARAKSSCVGSKKFGTRRSNCETEGVDVRAVTAWAAFGSFDWNSLLTSEAGCYESGVFDLRSTSAAADGFGEDDEDTCRQATNTIIRCSTAPAGGGASTAFCERRIIITRDHSQRPTHESDRRSRPSPLDHRRDRHTRQSFRAHLRATRTLVLPAGRDRSSTSRSQTSVKAAVDRFEPWAIINAAGYVRVDDAENEVDRCMRENVSGPANLATSVRRRVRFRS